MVTDTFSQKDKKICPEVEINNLYLRAKGRGDFRTGRATDWLQANNVKVVNGTTFYPSDQQTIWREGLEYWNIYRKPTYKKLNNFRIENIDWFFKLMRFLVLTTKQNLRH